MANEKIAERAARLPRAKPAMSEPCASCGEKCCNRFAVPISGFDMLRIMRKLDCEPGEFCELDEAKYIQSAPHSTVFIFGKEGVMSERLLILKRLKTNYCIFSRHSHGCAIWGFHPMACKAYPFAFVGKEAGGKDKIGYTRNFVCPRPWEKGEYDEGGVRTVLDAMEREMAEYNIIVREWNATRAKEGGEKEFFKFLIEKSGKKMELWEKKEMPDAQELPSLGPKRGYIEPEWKAL
ncbi:MAG: YkgJ family cysteine cluster protein [Candidatus Micrarchaeota archaeon]